MLTQFTASCECVCLSPALSEACKTVGEEALKLLASLKIEKQSAGTISAGAAKLKSSIQSIEKEAEV